MSLSQEDISLTFKTHDTGSRSVRRTFTLPADLRTVFGELLEVRALRLTDRIAREAPRGSAPSPIHRSIARGREQTRSPKVHRGGESQTVELLFSFWILPLAILLFTRARGTKQCYREIFARTPLRFVTP